MGFPRFLPPSVLAGIALLWACAAQPAPKTTAPPAPSQAASAPARLNFATSCGIPGLRENVLRQVNAARASGKTCGRERMPPAPPLVWNDMLFSAAARHSADMARRNYFDHVSPDGERIGARATAEGYSWRAIGENIAGGDRTVNGTLRGWIASPGHCRNIMNPEYTEIGLACVQRSGTTWGSYWTMVLGRRR